MGVLYIEYIYVTQASKPTANGQRRKVHCASRSLDTSVWTVHVAADTFNSSPKPLAIYV